jgi:hypothetical protein
LIHLAGEGERPVHDRPCRGEVGTAVTIAIAIAITVTLTIAIPIAIPITVSIAIAIAITVPGRVVILEREDAVVLDAPTVKECHDDDRGGEAAFH